MTDPDTPAFPRTAPISFELQNGMTIREHYVIEVLKAVVGRADYNLKYHPFSIAEEVVAIVDATLEKMK